MVSVSQHSVWPQSTGCITYHFTVRSLTSACSCACPPAPPCRCGREAGCCRYTIWNMGRNYLFLSVCSVLISQTKWCCVVIGVNVQFPPKKFYHQLAGLSGWSLGHGSVFLQTINQRDWLLVQFKSTLKPTSCSNTATFIMDFQKYLYDTK